ncbi:hypothetical protein J2X69_000636 [Algoriphagus sp. 4150]|uniref:hypothetical protein n=1 Tax=Algoriphagus sp. 4150 TaxID=2817756 RepID=UPI00285671D6|nr:hypothetical protein [Algoriphagus sp. 4150]MDR7128308.1 hypothetical protein [Algoriphagus sp. 4150]
MKKFTNLLMKSCLLIILLLLMAVPTYSQYKLSKIDEFKINSLLDVDIVDYSPKNKLYLGFMNSSEGDRILLINKKGEIIANKNLKGQEPNQYVSNLNAMTFSKDGDIWLQTVTHILLYDQMLVQKKRIPYPSSVKMQIYGRKEAFPYFYKDSPESGFSFITNPSGTNSYMPNGKTNSDLIEVYNTEIDELHRIAPIADRSIYGKLDNSLVSSLYFIVYSINKNSRKVFLTTRLDDEITVYNLETGKLESKIKINHGDFKVLKLNTIASKDLSSDGRESLGARNHKVFSMDNDLIVLDYIKEIPYGIYEIKKADDPSYQHMQDADYHKLILFDGNRQVSEDIPMPTNGHLMLGLLDDQLLFKIVDPDVEEDFIRYQVFKLVKE